MNRAARLLGACLFTGLTLTACLGGSNDPSPATAPPPPPAPSADASLAGLRLSTGDLDQVFQPAVNDYSATTSFLAARTTVFAIASDENASISINGAEPATGEASDSVVLADGANLVTVTVTAEDGVTGDSYSLNISRADAAGLAHVAYVKASTPAAGDRFGNAVAFAGDTFAVATVADDGTGAVHVFRHDLAGTWVEEAYLKASNAAEGHSFGYSIALSGDTLAVGANGEDGAATGVGGDAADTSAIDAGAAYVFVRDGTGMWSQQAYLKASNTETLDGFGTSVALDGDTLAVGAQFEDSAATGIDGNPADNGAADSGAVYVFTRDAGGDWSQQAYVKASNTDPGDHFGRAIALSGSTLVVGAPGEASRAAGIDGSQASNNSAGAGAAYAFVRDETGAWSQQAYIKASNPDGLDDFGLALSLSGDTLVVGAPREDSAAIGIDGFENDNRALNSGAAYVFVRDGSGSWSQQAYVKASNTGSQDRFGRAVANFGEFLAVGALDDSSATDFNGDQADNATPNSGAVYLFSRSAGGVWGQASYIKAGNTGTSDGFGVSVALSDAALLVGADLEDSSASGIGGDMTDDSAADAGAVYLVQ